MRSLKKKTNHLNCKLSFRSHWNEDRLAAVYIEELAHGSSFCRFTKLVSRGCQARWGDVSVCGGVVKCTEWRSRSQLNSPIWSSCAELKTPTTQASHVEIGLCLLRKGLPPFILLSGFSRKRRAALSAPAEKSNIHTWIFMLNFAEQYWL